MGLRREIVAHRKQFLEVGAVSPKLAALLDRAKDRTVTQEELVAQRESFAYGNAMNIDGVTKDSVRQTAMQISLLA